MQKVSQITEDTNNKQKFNAGHLAGANNSTMTQLLFLLVYPIKN